MGEAKRRGNREQRIAQAIERKKAEDAAMHERYRIEEAKRRAELATLPPKERKEVILAGGHRGHSNLRALSAMLGLAMARNTSILVMDDFPIRQS